VDGVLVVDKPGGWTSHDVVASARRHFGVRAVGHAGTLDPMATGVLVLLFGEACKLSNHLTADDKTYRATVAFGAETDSLDADGTLTRSVELSPGWLAPQELERALDSERRRTQQVPPAVSAIQMSGERAYARARRGEAVELAPRPVAVRTLTCLQWSGEEATIELTVTKGYYVRAFARDLGQSLGVPAHLRALRRLSSGVFDLSEAYPWPPEERPVPANLTEVATRALPVTKLTETGARRARLGQRLAPDDAVAGARDRTCAWLSPDGALVALGTTSAAGEHRLERGFAHGRSLGPG